MDRFRPPPDVLAARILTAIEANRDPADVRARLEALGLTPDEAGWALEAVQAARARAFFLTAGIHPARFGEEMARDPIFQATLAQLLGPHASLKARIRRLWQRLWGP